jgi:hypothetical protein
MRSGPTNTYLGTYTQLPYGVQYTYLGIYLPYLPILLVP